VWWVIIGSALGGMARHGVSLAVARRIGGIFPWGTLVVNVSGSFVVGLVAAALAAGDSGLRSFLIPGLCGGYTTFSSFSLQTLSLAQRGAWRRVGLNIAASLIFCFVAVWAGLALGVSLRGG